MMLDHARASMPVVVCRDLPAASTCVPPPSVYTLHGRRGRCAPRDHDDWDEEPGLVIARRASPMRANARASGKVKPNFGNRMTLALHVAPHAIASPTLRTFRLDAKQGSE